MPKILITNGPLAGTVIEGTASGGIILGDASPDTGGELGYAANRLVIHDGTAARNLVMEGVATGGIILGDSSPDAEGEVGYASNALSVHDGTASRDVLLVASTKAYIIDAIPISWAIDGGTAPGALTTLDSTNKARYREFVAAGGDVFFEWMVPYGIDTTVSPTFQVEGWVTNAVGPAQTETIQFTLQGGSYGDSDILSTALGNAITVTYTEPTPATHIQYDRLITGYSAAVTITSLAAGELVILKLARLAEDTYEQPFGVGWLKVKYAIKVQGS